MAPDEVGELDRTLEWLIGPALGRLADLVAAQLSETEVPAVVDATRAVLLDTLRRKVNRVLV